MPPLIGITCSSYTESGRDWLYQTRDYFTAVQKAGGMPVLLPHLAGEAEAAALLERLDGLLLSGGGDLDPRHYGELPHPHLGEVDPDRDRTELALARQALALGMPILAICRGEQVLAVAAGGRLWQDIPSQVPGALQHRQQAPRWHASHPVAVQPGTRLAHILGAGEVWVNSFHHQAVREVPPGFRVAAVAPDGVIEAFEGEGPRFAVAVQWHPENFAPRGGAFDALFAAHVAAAAEYGAARRGR